MSDEKPEEFEYKNEYVLNQRGGSLRIDNTTDKESTQLSQRSGSNINLTNVVNSEFAANNKQVTVTSDLFHTVGGDETTFVSGDVFKRTGSNTHNFHGYKSDSEIQAFAEWKALMIDEENKIPQTTSMFDILRGGFSEPNGVPTPLVGTRASNPTLNNKPLSLNNEFQAYYKVPVVSSVGDEVQQYVPVLGRVGGVVQMNVSAGDIVKAAGEFGSKAKGVLKYGGQDSAATEGGDWNDTTIDEKPKGKFLADKLVEMQEEKLSEIEEKMGDGGSEINFYKKNVGEIVGAEFNDFPSIRVDPEGRSQPIEKLLTDKGVITNYDSIPVIERVDNDSAFACGEKNVTVGNRYTVKVGSGGFSVRSTGGITMAGTYVDISGKDVKINGAYNVHIGGENGVEIASKDNITIRTNRQIFMQGSVGIHKNLIAGSGVYVDGELYCHHITAPIEVQQTEDTRVFGKFATNNRRTLPIGEVYNQVSKTWEIVYAYPNPDLILNEPHSHHFNNIPIRLMKSDEDLRKVSQAEGINQHGVTVPAISVYHERKRPWTVS